MNAQALRQIISGLREAGVPLPAIPEEVDRWFQTRERLAQLPQTPHWFGLTPVVHWRTVSHALQTDVVWVPRARMVAVSEPGSFLLGRSEWAVDPDALRRFL